MTSSVVVFELRGEVEYRFTGAALPGGAVPILCANAHGTLWLDPDHIMAERAVEALARAADEVAAFGGSVCAEAHIDVAISLAPRIRAPGLGGGS